MAATPAPLPAAPAAPCSRVKAAVQEDVGVAWSGVIAGAVGAAGAAAAGDDGRGGTSGDDGRAAAHGRGNEEFLCARPGSSGEGGWAGMGSVQRGREIGHWVFDAATGEWAGVVGRDGCGAGS